MVGGATFGEVFLNYIIYNNILLLNNIIYIVSHKHDTLFEREAHV